jgi:hypothetical protein
MPSTLNQPHIEPNGAPRPCDPVPPKACPNGCPAWQRFAALSVPNALAQSPRRLALGFYIRPFLQELLAAEHCLAGMCHNFFKCAFQKE